MTTDTSERGLEDLIVAAMTAPVGSDGNNLRDTTGLYAAGGWILGDWRDYVREYAVDIVQMREFLLLTQPHVADAAHIGEDDPTRRAFLARLQGEITRGGVIKVLREGIKHGPHRIELFFGSATPGNTKAASLFAANRFSVTRQLRYSRDGTQLALDLALFINGLPVATLELKNLLTKQTVMDAVEQYRRDRDPRELLFSFGRCLAHFAIDDQEVRFCTELKGKASWFLPFNKGWNDGAGNPPNPDGVKTDYLWKQVLTRTALTDIIEHYAQIVEVEDRKTRRKKRTQVFPRYHQLDVVHALLRDARARGAGRRYLIQHSAGSGKSNSIAWLAHQLIGLESDAKPVFDTVVVVTDRRILDKQIKDTVKQFAQVKATVGHAERSGDLRGFIQSGKKIIITTVQKFPFVLDEIGSEHSGSRFAIVIDEAHSSQSGKTAQAMNQALTGATTEATDEEESTEDRINRLIEARKLLPNASYFAFTATPKNKTLEIFGEPMPQADGTVKHRPFHSYTMKQAIEEGFILDVLRHYTPINSYYKLIKKIEDDPLFDTRRAQKKLRRYVESHDHAIRLKAEIMVDHFVADVLQRQKVGGQARSMVVTSGIERAIQYFHAISAYLVELKSPYRVIVAFSGEHEFAGKKMTEASVNGFASSLIAERVAEDPYRLLVVADKFLTGYDEPLLHSMYVDKPLAGIKAVQTLSRVNRAHPKKSEVFVLDFMNDADIMREAFEPYYRTTVLSEETDPNKLHDLMVELEGHQVYSSEQVHTLVELFLGGAPRERLDAILDVWVATYKELDEDAQVAFKGAAKAFVRTYAFLSAILPFAQVEWERMSIVLNLLIPKLPAPREEDLAHGILETIDMDSYRVEKQTAMSIALADSDAEIAPVPTSGGGARPEPEMDRLSGILRSFNDLFGNLPWEDRDRVHELLTEQIPQRVGADPAYRNAQANSDRQNARIEHDKALARVLVSVMKDDTELFRQYSDNDGFRRWLADTVFGLTYGSSSSRDVSPAVSPR